MNDKILKWVGDFVISILVYVIAALLIGFLVMFVWNSVVPSIFGLTTITYYQGFMLSWLCALLFKGSTSVTTKD